MKRLIMDGFSELFGKKKNPKEKPPKKYYFQVVPDKHYIGRARYIVPIQFYNGNEAVLYLRSFKNFSHLGTCYTFGILEDRDMVFGDGCPRYTGKIIRSERSASYKRFWYTTKLARFVRS